MSGTFGKYVLVERLAIGGMAEVYRAVHRGPATFEKTVALKRILPAYANHPEFRRRFVAEARVAADLAHSNIVQVIDFGELDGQLYLALEFVDGMDVARLHARVRAGGERLGLAAVYIVAEAARGLAYAHAATRNGKPLKLVHRDITPHNIMVSVAGAVKLADFGIAKVETSYHGPTAKGALLGKVRYVSPEQVTGGAVDSRSDIFALGLVLWELLVGECLLDARTPAGVIDQLKLGDLPRPSRRAIGISAELDRIVARALELDRERRYQTAAELAQDLEAFLRADPVGFGTEQLRALVAAARASAPKIEAKPQSKETAVLARPDSGDEPLWPQDFAKTTPADLQRLADLTREGGDNVHLTRRLPPDERTRWRWRWLGALGAAPIALGAFFALRAIALPVDAVDDAAAATPSVSDVAPAVETGHVMPAAAIAGTGLAASASPPASRAAPAPAPPAATASPAAPPTLAPAPAAEPPRPRRPPPAAEATSAPRARAREATRRGDELLAGGDSNAAAQAFREALEAEPDFAPALLGVGKAYALQGQLEQAAIPFRRYLRARPNSAESASVRRWLAQIEPAAATP